MNVSFYCSKFHSFIVLFYFLINVIIVCQQVITNLEVGSQTFSIWVVFVIQVVAKSSISPPSAQNIQQPPYIDSALITHAMDVLCCVLYNGNTHAMLTLT